MKQRTFFITLALFLLFLNLGIFLISMAMFKDTVSRAEERSLDEHYFITSALMRDFHAVESREIALDDSLNSLLKSYRYWFSDKKAGFALYKNNQPVYANQDNFSSILQQNGLKAPEDGSRLISIRKTDGKIYAIVCGKLPSPYAAYTMAYFYDMTDSINSWSKLKNTLFLAGLFLSVLLALGLLLVLNRIFKPLDQISQTSKAIANGAYETRLLVAGQDEISEMAHSFNDMAETIQRQMKELKAAADKKQQFVDNFAHELRTPMTAIYGYAEYMQKAALSEDDRLSALNYIMLESRRLQTIASQLLELADLKNHQITGAEQRVSDLFETVKQTLEGKIAEKEIQLEFICKIETIWGDVGLLESLLLNLMDNAIKACEKGGRIVVQAVKKDGGKAISIQDNGKGMSAEVLAQITEPFYRGEKARNRKDGGAGLGLAICKQIVLQHDAALKFISRPGEGTTAMIFFTK